MTDTNLTPAIIGDAESLKNNPEVAEEYHNAMTDPKLILAFIFGGDATLTFRSVHSGTRYTYRIQEGTAAGGRIAPFFVKVLTGADNENDYTYLGMVAGDSRKFRTTKATKNPTSQPVKAFTWALNILLQDKLPENLEIWHEGRCARCSRKLTDPASIASGFGPECIKMSGGLAGLTNAGEVVLLDAKANSVPASPAKAPTKTTPAEVVAKVNEDPDIDFEASRMADELKTASLSEFTMDGIMTEEEADIFWYNRFKTNKKPVGVQIGS